MVRIPEDEVKELGLNEALAKKMAPYQENNMGDCPQEFLEFHDVEPEYREQYEGETEFILTPDGELKYSWDFKKPKVGGLSFETEEYIPDGHQKVTRPFCLKYPTFQDFMEKYAEYKRNPETGKYGYWENPNRKWDWYTIGGRWRGKLIPKQGAEGTLGRPGVFKNESMKRPGALRDKGGVDAIQAKDVDFAAMDALVNEQVEEFYSEVETYRVASKEEREKLWFDLCWTLGDLGLIVQDTEKKATGEIKDFTLNDLKNTYRSHWEFHTYAVVDETGQWIGQGEMGWWGCSSETTEEGMNWDASFKQQHLTNVDPNTYLVIVDCHI